MAPPQLNALLGAEPVEGWKLVIHLFVSSFILPSFINIYGAQTLCQVCQGIAAKGTDETPSLKAFSFCCRLRLPGICSPFAA